VQACQPKYELGGRTFRMWAFAGFEDSDTAGELLHQFAQIALDPDTLILGNRFNPKIQLASQTIAVSP